MMLGLGRALTGRVRAAGGRAVLPRAWASSGTGPDGAGEKDGDVQESMRLAAQVRAQLDGGKPGWGNAREQRDAIAREAYEEDKAEAETQRGPGRRKPETFEEFTKRREKEEKWERTQKRRALLMAIFGSAAAWHFSPYRERNEWRRHVAEGRAEISQGADADVNKVRPASAGTVKGPRMEHGVGAWGTAADAVRALHAHHGKQSMGQGWSLALGRACAVAVDASSGRVWLARSRGKANKANATSGDAVTVLDGVLPGLGWGDRWAAATMLDGAGVCLVRSKNGKVAAVPLDNVDHAVPVKVGGSIVHIAGGDAHALLLDSYGRVYGYGNGSAGQLGQDLGTDSVAVAGTGTGIGIGETVAVPLPGGVRKVVDVACGAQHSVLVTDDGRAFAAGADSHAQLGSHRLLYGVGENVYTQQVDADGRAVHKGKSNMEQLFTREWTPVWLPPSNPSTPTQQTEAAASSQAAAAATPATTTTAAAVAGVTPRIVSAACGARHTVLLTDTGRGITFGAGQHGQLGNGLLRHVDVPRDMGDIMPFGSSGEDAVAEVACGAEHCVARTMAGALWTWGYVRHIGMDQDEE